MRVIRRRSTLSAPVAAALLALFSAACDRDVLQQEARPADGPSLAVAGASAEELGPVGLAAVNDSGEFVGNTASGAFRWTRQGGLEPLSEGQDVHVNDLNNLGLAVGVLRVAPPTGTVPTERAVIWPAGGQMQLLDLPQGASSARAVAVNDGGIVVGTAHYANSGIRSLTRAFRWSPATGTQLLPEVSYNEGTTGSYSDEYVVDVNAAGDVLGGAEAGCTSEGPGSVCRVEHASESHVVWTRFGEVRYLEKDILPAGARATVLTDSGHVGGCWENAPVLWRAFSEQRQVIGENGCVTDLSESGFAVGYHQPPPLGTRGRPQAFRWTAEGGMENVGPLDGSESRATAVNEAGDVAGWMTPSGGAMRAFLWTPTGGLQALAPLPGSDASTGAWVGDDRAVIGESVTGTGDAAARRVTRWYDVVYNAPPVAVLDLPTTRLISGRRYIFSAEGTFDPDGDPLRYYWNMDGVGRSEGFTTGPQFGYAYPAAGRYAVRLEVLDDDGRGDAAFGSVEVVQNVAPIANVTGMPTSRAEGAPITLTPSVRDANAAVDSSELTLMRYRWDWGDGYTSNAMVSTHAYADQGTYTVRMIVTDAGGLADSVVRTAIIGNIKPTGRLVAPSTVREGTQFSLQAASLQDGPADLAAGLQLAFNCGSGFGTYGAAKFAVCPGRPDQGPVTVGMRIRDKDGGATEVLREITVGNVAPKVTASGQNSTLPAGSTFYLNYSFTDPGADAPWRYRIYWGDGTYTPIGNTAPGDGSEGGYLETHVYQSAGTYSVQVAVVDKDGATGRSVPFTVNVTR
jgi:PKD repeat protein